MQDVYFFLWQDVDGIIHTKKLACDETNKPFFDKLTTRFLGNDQDNSDPDRAEDFANLAAEIHAQTGYIPSGSLYEFFEKIDETKKYIEQCEKSELVKETEEAIKNDENYLRDDDKGKELERPEDKSPTKIYAFKDEEEFNHLKD